MRNMHKKMAIMAIGVMAFAMSAAAQTAAGNVSSGQFGSNTGGGTYSFPGNVGIGTTSPAQPLTVNGAGYFYGAAGDPSIFLGKGDAGVTNLNWGIVDTGQDANNRLAIGNSSGTGGLSGFSERVSVLGNGNVGIGTASPAAALHVVSSGNIVPSITYGSPAGVIFNTAAQELAIGVGNSPYATWLQVRNWANNAMPLSLNPLGGNVGIGTTSPGAPLEVDGNVKLTAGSGASMTFQDGTTQSTAWNGTLTGGDYAESIDVLGDRAAYEPGDVIVIDDTETGKFNKSAQSYSKLVAGVYSTKPGLVGRRTTADRPDKEAEVPMAMMGIVPTKVTTENGPIGRGDLLVSSSRPGYAMKGTDRDRLTGAVIGKALAPLKSGSGVIEVLISLQ